MRYYSLKNRLARAAVSERSSEEIHSEQNITKHRKKKWLRKKRERERDQLDQKGAQNRASKTIIGSARLSRCMQTELINTIRKQLFHTTTAVFMISDISSFPLGQFLVFKVRYSCVFIKLSSFEVRPTTSFVLWKVPWAASQSKSDLHILDMPLEFWCPYGMYSFPLSSSRLL